MPDIAEELYESLLNTTVWDREGEHSSKKETENVAAVKQDENYRFAIAYFDLASPTAPASVNALNAYLNSKELISWISEVSGRKYSFFHGRAALYNSGDHISRHNDHYVHETENNKILTRAVTFNYYLTKAWDPEWGGKFIWERPHSVIVPSFNTLVMFLVGPGSMHHVEPVETGVEEKRMAITGWFYSAKESKYFSGKLNIDYINSQGNK